MTTTNSFQKLLLFWTPLSVNWFMMGLESPIIAAFISRFPNQENNLAAHGVAFSIALFIEAPIIMMLSASNAMIHGKNNYLRMRNFNLALCGILTILIAAAPTALVWPIVEKMLGLSEVLSERTQLAVAFLLPWPAAIGIRRFYHGLLINSGKTAAVAWGTLLRMATMTLVVTALATFSILPPFCVGTAALSAGVIAELAYAWHLSRSRVKELLQTPDPDKILSTTEITKTYLPLAMTSLMSFALSPILTLFMTRSPLPLESMAVFPLVSNLVFLVCCPVLCLQEVLITWFAQYPSDKNLLARATLWTGVLAAFTILLIANTPLHVFWFGNVSGLTTNLLGLIPVPLTILSLQAANGAIMTWQRAKLIASRNTRPITHSAAAEILGMTLVFTLLRASTPLTGITIAAISLVVGRAVSVATLIKKS
jgi:hypothetical protein